MSAIAKRKPEQTNHPDTGLPYAEPPPDVQKLIQTWDISLDSVRVYVKPVVVEEKTSGGIIMPDTAKGHNFKSGYVISTGPDAIQKVWNSDHTGAVEYALQPGDLVHWGKYSSTAATDRHERGEKNLFVMNGESLTGDILGVISHGR